MWEVAAFCSVLVLLLVAGIVIQRGFTYDKGFRDGQQEMFFRMQAENLKFAEDLARQEEYRNDRRVCPHCRLPHSIVTDCTPDSARVAYDKT
jgi:hypothetical protein